MEAQERARLVDLWGEDEADAFLATDPVNEAVEAVMDGLDVACAFSVVPAEAHDGHRHLVQVWPYSERLAKRIKSAVAKAGGSAEVRELPDRDLPPWRR